MDALATSLDRAVTECLRGIGVPAPANRASTVDVTVVTEEEAAARTGASPLLTSLHAPPIKIWDREA